jgi:threonine/homoserine/homoserine lactone efflux protein
MAKTTGSMGMAWASALLLTLTNPPTIVSFFAIFTALAPADFNVSAALTMTGGVLVGSLAWWIVITTLVGLARRSLGAGVRRWIDRIAGLALGAFGAAELRRATR